MQKQTQILNPEVGYNQAISISTLTREEVINPAEYNLLCYSRPSDISPDGLPVGKLGNQASGFPFSALGHEWKGSEFLYLCGRWSLDTQGEIQKELASQRSGYIARRFTYNKYYQKRRKDFDIFKHHWMLWVVWQKCIGNEDFRKLLLSMPSDRIICEVEKRDPVWAFIRGEDGKLYGCNAMGKILTLCKRALETNMQPEIDYDLLNQSNIYIFGEKVMFRQEE